MISQLVLSDRRATPIAISLEILTTKLESNNNFGNTEVHIFGNEKVLRKYSAKRS